MSEPWRPTEEQWDVMVDVIRDHGGADAIDATGVLFALLPIVRDMVIDAVVAKCRHVGQAISEMKGAP